VTIEEYEAAVAQTARCASERGVQVEMVPRDGRRPSSIGFAAGSLAAADEAKKILDDCRAQFLSEIETTWALQQADVSADETLAAHRRLTECLIDRGQAFDDGLFSVDDLNLLLTKQDRSETDLRLLYDYQVCSKVVEQELGYSLP
jgi:hypothetical protein